MCRNAPFLNSQWTQTIHITPNPCEIDLNNKNISGFTINNTDEMKMIFLQSQE